MEERYNTHCLGVVSKQITKLEAGYERSPKLDSSLTRISRMTVLKAELRSFKIILTEKIKLQRLVLV